MSDRCVTFQFSDGDRVIEVEKLTVGPRRVLIIVVGEVDHFTCPLLRSTLTRTWEVRPVAVTVDLRQVTFINAAGLRTLLAASGTARARGVPLVLQAGPGQVTRLLTMVGFREQVLPSCDAEGGLATDPNASRPVLRLVSSTEVADSDAPAAAASGSGQAVCGDLHVVQALSPAHTGQDQVAAQHGLASPAPMAGRDGAAANGVVGPATTSRLRAEDLPSLEGIGAARSWGEPAAARRATLSHALLSRELVGRATGMLMQRDRITADEALAFLADASRNRNQSIVVVAEELTAPHLP
jgi:anti-sigma B factor antagonist